MINTALIRKDLKLLSRDTLLMLILVLPLLLAAAVKLFHMCDPLRYLPFETDSLKTGGLLRRILPLFGGVMAGWITGFLILDEKEKGLVPQLQVTPPGKKALLDSRLFLSLAAGFSINTLLWLGDGLLYDSLGESPLPFWGSSLLGPFITTVMARWGKNRVQGLTLAKLTSLLIVPPVLSQVLPSSYRALCIVLSPATLFLHDKPARIFGGAALLLFYTGVIRKRA